MSFDFLPTLAEVNASRRAVPKSQVRTRMEDKTAAKKNDSRALEAWKAAVRRRDRMRCRVCKRKVRVTMELVPDRAECHHIRGRAHKPTRYDRRNGVLCCLTCHGKFKKGLVVVGQKADTFQLEAGGEFYLNADCPLEFK